MKNWVDKHDLLSLSRNLGKYFGAYYEYKPEDAESSIISMPCSACQAENPILMPSKEARERFHSELKSAMIGAPSGISPNLKHFWYHARCSICGEDVALMRS